MKILLGLIAVMGMLTGIKAQIVDGRDNVKKLCGCYEVEFKYAETFSPLKDYKFHERDEISGGVELTLAVEESKNKIVMQHLLVISDSMIIKHWREDWTFENPVLWKYLGDNVWIKQQLSPEQVRGKWTQSVWEVSDAPRYQGASPWVNLDDKTFWLNTTDAPLPRREYTIRNDYNILRRTNRLVLNEKGYNHEQDNQKLIRKDAADQLLAEEKGINSYVRVDDGKCEAARIWWGKNKIYWIKVKTVWDHYLDTHNTVVLKNTIDGKQMHEDLMDMADDYAAGKIKNEDIDARIKSSFDKYVSDSRSTEQPK